MGKTDVWPVDPDTWRSGGQNGAGLQNNSEESSTFCGEGEVEPSAFPNSRLAGCMCCLLLFSYAVLQARANLCGFMYEFSVPKSKIATETE